jgi:hypothetical protein
MVSIPVLTFFLVVITIYLAGCFAYHVRDVREKRADQKDKNRRSGSGRGGPHAIHP